MLVPMEATRLVNGATVAALREATGIRQNKLAEAAGVSPSFLSNIEAGRKQPSPATARALADCLGVSLDAITYPAIMRPKLGAAAA